MRPSAVLLWGTVAALLLGLIAMHHAPSHGGHVGHRGVAASQVTTAGDMAGCDCPPDPASSPGGGSSSLELLLHLCQAVLGAGVALLVARLLLRVLRFLPGAPRRPSVTAARVARAPPPTPVPRRLAALCVLRI